MADFLLVRIADNAILGERINQNPLLDGAPKAGREWREWLQVSVDTSTGPNKTTDPMVRTFVTEGGHLTPNVVKDTTTTRDMNAGEIDTKKDNQVTGQFPGVALEGFWELYNACFFIWRISNPTGTKAQFASAISTWLATEGSGTQVALTHQQVRDHLKGFIS